MKRDEIKQLMRGVINATVTPFDDDFQIDYGLMAELTHWWIENGLVNGKAVIKVSSVMGEGPMLRDDEFAPLVRTVVQAADGRVPVMAGSHCKDTLRTIDDAKRAQDVGAIGMQIAPPMFNDPSQDDILRYCEAISDAIEIGLMVYNNHWYPYSGVSLETFRKMADFEYLVAIKWNPPESVEYDSIFDMADVFNIFDNSNQWVRCHKLGGAGILDTTVTAYPPHDMKVWELIEASRYEEAQVLIDSIAVPIGKLYEKANYRSGGQSRIKKGLMAVMGHPVGAMRPPSLPMSDKELDGLRQMAINAGWPIPEKAITPAVPA